MDSLPKIALVGRPNVGKSALFNRICQKRLSIVDEQEGVTRDRLYVQIEFFGRELILIDTAGIDGTSTQFLNEQVKIQSERAIQEADVAILVVDARVGLTPLDREVAKILLQGKKPALVAVNKMDCLQDEWLVHEFHSLGFSQVISVSATQGHHIAELMEQAVDLVPLTDEIFVEDPASPIRVAIAGRPNVGKSTLLNCLLNDQRSVVSSVAGTTRDAVDVPFSKDGQDYLLIDTAGICRKKSEKEVVDKFAAIRTKEAIERSDVVLLVLDSFEGFTVQEKRIASEIEESGKSCILLFNKWDLIKGMRMEHAFRAVREEVSFLAHCPAIFLSASQNRNCEKIFPLIQEVYKARNTRISTGMLNQFIAKCLQKYHPPMLMGKRLRIYYMAQVQVAPPRFVLFVNQPRLMTESYRKYLINQFREMYLFSGAPLTFSLRGKKTATGPIAKKISEAGKSLDEVHSTDPLEFDISQENG